MHVVRPAGKKSFFPCTLCVAIFDFFRNTVIPKDIGVDQSEKFLHRVHRLPTDPEMVQKLWVVYVPRTEKYRSENRCWREFPCRAICLRGASWLRCSKSTWHCPSVDFAHLDVLTCSILSCASRQEWGSKSTWHRPSVDFAHLDVLTCSILSCVSRQDWGLCNMKFNE